MSTGVVPADDEAVFSMEESIMSKIIPSVLAATLAALIVACGGSGSSSNMSNLTPVLATGTITGFGSIYVNGVHFQTSSATIRKNGQMVAESQLAVGEVARVKGQKNATDGTGVADGQNPPILWNGKKNESVRWKTAIPGLGHSCPVVWGNWVFLTTAKRAPCSSRLARSTALSV